MIAGLAISLVLFVALLAALELGRFIRRSRRKFHSDDNGLSAGDGVVFSVLGLLIAFTFNTAASRFDERRKLINEQANAIGTAWLRVELLAESDRESIRRPMREWVNLSLEATPSRESDPAKFKADWKELLRLQDEAWHAAVAAIERCARPQYASLLLTPMNQWIDLTSTRRSMGFRGLPPLVVPTLITLSLLGGVLAGFATGQRPARSLVHMIAFAGAIAICLYVITDLDHPRSGVIRIDEADDAMKELYESIASESRPVGRPESRPATTGAGDSGEVVENGRMNTRNGSNGKRGTERGSETVSKMASDRS